MRAYPHALNHSCPLPQDEDNEHNAAWVYDTSKLDIHSADFHSLPYEIQHEILVDKLEQDKNRSLSKRVNTKVDDTMFSLNQVQNLKKRNRTTQMLEDVRAKLLCVNSDDGVLFHKIVSESNSVYILEKKPPARPDLVDAWAQSEAAAAVKKDVDMSAGNADTSSAAHQDRQYTGEAGQLQPSLCQQFVLLYGLRVTNG